VLLLMSDLFSSPPCVNDSVEDACLTATFIVAPFFGVVSTIIYLVYQTLNYLMCCLIY